MLQLLPPIYAIYRQPAGLGALLLSRRSTIRLWWSAAAWAGRLAALAAVLGLMQIVAAAALCLEISASAAMATAGSENFFRAHHERGGLR